MESFQEERQEDFGKALAYAHKLISIRLRTEKELKMRMRMKEFSAETIQKVTQILNEEGLLNDAEFAREYLESKIHSLWHPRIIYYELIKKGVAQEIAKKITDEVDLRELSEKVKEKALYLNERNSSLPLKKRKHRIYSYFMRRGFSSDLLKEILS